MTPSDDKIQNSEAGSEAADETVRVDASGDEALDATLDELADGVIAEIAREHAGEEKSSSSGKAQADPVQSKTQKDEALLEEQTVLRERLLKSAPPERAMRHEVIQALEAKKEKLEANMRDYQKRKEYDLWSEAVAQWRAVIHQMTIAAHASFEALRELWLKVLHNFA